MNEGVYPFERCFRDLAIKGEISTIRSALASSPQAPDSVSSGKKPGNRQ
jgi:hypothetical protein